MSSVVTDVVILASTVTMVNLPPLPKRHDRCLDSAHYFESTRERAGFVRGREALLVLTDAT